MKKAAGRPAFATQQLVRLTSLARKLCAPFWLSPAISRNNLVTALYFVAWWKMLN
jgi:hypothetical protein